MEGRLKNVFLSFGLVAAVLGFASNSAVAVEYTKVCTLFGPGYYYAPGTDTCYNPTTGVAKELTQAGVWSTLAPYPQGKWVADPQNAQNVQAVCGHGRLVKIGDFQASSLVPNAYNKIQTPPVPTPLQTGEMITKVVMKGGFFDPRVPGVRNGLGFATSGMCLRSVDPAVLEAQPSEAGATNPPFGDGGLPIGCINMSRIVNMPRAYSVPATASYPNIDAYFLNSNQQPPVQQYQYGTMLTVTTDLRASDLATFSYCDDPTGATCGGGHCDPTTLICDPLGAGRHPLAGVLSVWVCVDGGQQ